MGLDNGFVIRSTDYPDLGIHIAYFRKYYELDTWMMRECNHTSEYEVSVSKNDVEKLIKTITPIVEELFKLGITKVGYYDENGYPKKYNLEFYNNDFNPVDSPSFMAGVKLCNLYYALQNIYDVLDHNNDLYITFYSSF